MIGALLLAATLGVHAPGAGQVLLAPRWNPKAPENAQILSTFNYATVEPVLNAIGARYQRASTDRAKPALVVVFPNGRKALVSMSSCDPEGAVCKALSMQANWTKIANAPRDKTAQAIEQFNDRYSFSKAYLTADGRPALQRYLTADYGFVRGNLAVNLLVFANQADRLAVEVLGPLEAGQR